AYLIASAAYVFIVARHFVVVPFFAQLALGGLLWARSGRRRPIDPSTGLVLVWAGFVSWTAAVAFTMPTFPVSTTFLTWALDASPYTLGIFAAALILVTVELWSARAPASPPRARLVGNALAFAVFALASLRTEHLHHQVAFHHWGVFVGPAEMVRQGGWLLWDVPS